MINRKVRQEKQQHTKMLLSGGGKQGMPFLVAKVQRLPVSHSALLLNSVMRTFRPEFVAARATDFIGMIKECDEAGFPKVRGRGHR